MTTGKMVVLGAYNNRAGADHAVNELTSEGFDTAEISILLPDDRGAATVENAKYREPKDIPEKVTELSFKETKDISSGRSEDVAARDTKIPQGAGTGAGIGAALTGLVVPG
ncbi:MAG: hypothetical protein WA673_20445, partial [Candidatus Acidiferrales bacterium]